MKIVRVSELDALFPSSCLEQLEFDDTPKLDAGVSIKYLVFLHHEVPAPIRSA
jgi:hypothetical protein